MIYLYFALLILPLLWCSTVDVCPSDTPQTRIHRDFWSPQRCFLVQEPWQICPNKWDSRGNSSKLLWRKTRRLFSSCGKSKGLFVLFRIERHVRHAPQKDDYHLSYFYRSYHIKTHHFLSIWMKLALNSNTDVKMLILFVKYSPRRLLGPGGYTTHGYFQKESSKRHGKTIIYTLWFQTCCLLLTLGRWSNLAKFFQLDWNHHSVECFERNQCSIFRYPNVARRFFAKISRFFFWTHNHPKSNMPLSKEKFMDLSRWSIFFGGGYFQVN